MEPPPLAPTARTPALRLAEAAVVAAAGLVIVLIFLALDSAVPWIVAALALGGLALALVRGHPLLQLGVCLAASVLIMGGEEGVSVGEALYFGLTALFFAGWYTRELAAGVPSLRSTDDIVAWLWLLVGLGVAILVSRVFGANPADHRAEMISLYPFLFFFPVKEAVVRHRNGAALIAGALVGFALYTSVRNGFALRSVFAGADQWWQIADARFSTGETAMAAALMVTLSLFAALRSPRVRLALLAAFGVVLGGLLLTKSRGYWLSVLFGIGVLLAISPARSRARIATYLGLGTVALGMLAVVLFSDQLLLLVVGVVKRFSSLATAATTDISLLNRYAENAATWEEIRRNPILGHGWGNRITHYSVIGRGTRHWSFTHNMYLFVWHKVGLWGLALLLLLWGRAIVRGALAARSAALTPAQQAMATGAAASVAAIALVANTSNPLGVIDASLISTLALALAHGLAQRADAADTIAHRQLDAQPPGTA